MRKALAGLTTRGRSFLTAGLAAFLCGLFLGERDLIRISVLLLALPLLSAIGVAQTRYRLACRRRLSPARVPVGHDARMELRLDNVSRLPTGLLLVEDGMPYALGSRPRFVLDRIEPRGARELDYRVRSDLRGRFTLGPLVVRIADPFGMVELSRSFTGTDVLVVTPAIIPLPRTRLVADWQGGGDSRARSVAAAGEDDVAPREYRHGDDLRRVHWRSTARYGELMVRREEQQWHSRATVFVDTRRAAHRGDGPSSSFEYAVSAAASIGVHLAQINFDVRLVTDDGQVDAAGVVEDVLLDALAVARPTGRRNLNEAVPALDRAGGGLLVAVLGALTAEEAARLARVRHGAATRVAVLLDVAGWSPTRQARSGAAGVDAAMILRQAAWRVVPVSAGAPLNTVWAGVDHPASPGRESPPLTAEEAVS